LVAIGQVVSKEKIKMWKLMMYDGRTTDAYPWQKLVWPMSRWAKNESLLK
jgi:hypothetical protein